MAPEARGTNEASRRAEKSLTGHTRPFYFSTRLHPDVRVFCAYAFCLWLVFPPSSALRIRRVMQSSITVTRFPGSGFRPWRALCPSWASRPSRASCPFHLRALWWLTGFRGPVMGSVPSRALSSFSSGLLLALKFSSPFRAACTLFSNSLVSFEQCAPCSQILCFLSFAPGSQILHSP